MNEETTPTEHQADHTNYKDVVEIPRKGLVDKKPVFVDYQESVDSRESG